MELLKKNWPFLLATIMLATTILIVFRIALSMTNGSFNYAMDDAYIHMSIARNIDLYGIWGVTNKAFSSSSSSPLWTLLQASGFYFFGSLHNLSFWLNVTFSFVLLWLVQSICIRQNISKYLTFVVLICIVFFVPLIPLIFSGMEHVLQILLSLYFVDLASRLNKYGNEKGHSSNQFFLIITGMALCSLRYEGVFIVLAVAILLTYSSQIKFAIVLSVVSLIPQFIMAIFNFMNGWPAIPVPILLKASKSTDVSYLKHVFLRVSAFIHDVPHFTVLVVVLVIFFYFGLKKENRLNNHILSWLFIFLLASFLHAALARYGWFYRYEAYLMALGIVGFFLVISDILISFSIPNFEKKILIVVISAAVIVPMAANGLYATAITARGCRDVYEQQKQMGLFLNRYFSNNHIAANDIGAINWFAPNIRLLDTWGLATLEVAKAKMDGLYNSSTLEVIAQKNGVDIAIVYADEEHLPGGVPLSWRLIGDWSISKKTTANKEQVYFFAVAEGTDDELRQSLRSFISELPSTVTYNIYKHGKIIEPFIRRSL